jgi:CubicO group peptidase (beta-lactamase class C family)
VRRRLAERPSSAPPLPLASAGSSRRRGAATVAIARRVATLVAIQQPRASLFLLPWFASLAFAQQPEWLPKVEALLAARVQKPDAVGFSVGIAQRGQVLLAKGYGLAEAEHGAPATATTRFRIGSITKQFTAAAILRLVEQQQLSLDDELGKYVPEFPLQGK